MGRTAWQSKQSPPFDQIDPPSVQPSEQLQYVLKFKSTRTQEFTHGHGSPAATDCQCIFRDSWPVRRCQPLCPGTRRVSAVGLPRSRCGHDDAGESAHGAYGAACGSAAVAQSQAELQQQLAQAVVLDEDKQAEVASVGQARGVTLRDCRALLDVFTPGKGAQCRQSGAAAQAAGKKAGQLLAVLDEVARPRYAKRRRMRFMSRTRC